MDKLIFEYEKRKDRILTDHVSYLTTLKNTGFNPKVIYDIGSCILHWYNSARLVFPDARYIVFDANPELEPLYKSLNLEYYITVLSNCTDTVNYYNSIDNVDCIGGNGIYPEINLLWTDIQKTSSVITETISDIITKNGLPLPDLVKIDVQGAELQIVEGSGTNFDNAILLCEFPRFNYNLFVFDVCYSLEKMKVDGWNCIKHLFSDNGFDGDYAFSKTIPSEITNVCPESVLVLYETDSNGIPSGKFKSFEYFIKFIKFYDIKKYDDLFQTYQDKFTGKILTVDDIKSRMKTN